MGTFVSGLVSWKTKFLDFNAVAMVPTFWFQGEGTPGAVDKRLF